MTTRATRPHKTPRSAVAAQRWKVLTTPPQGLLAKVRWLFLCLSLFWLILPSPVLVLVGSQGWLLRGLAAGAIGFLAWHRVAQYRHRRSGPFWDLSESLAHLLIAVASGNPLATLGLLYVGLTYRALFESTRRVLFVLLLYLAALLGALVITQAGFNPPALAQVPGLAIMSFLIHFLALTLGRYERALEREEVLHTASARLVSALDQGQIWNVMLDACAGLLQKHARTHLYLLSGDQQMLSVTAAWGEGIKTDPDLTIPARLLASQNDYGQVLRALGLDTDWRLAVVDMPAKDTTTALLIASDGRLPVESNEALEMLGTLGVLALETMAAREEVLRRRSEVLFQALVQQSSDIIFVIDSHGKLSYVSPSVSRLLGYDASELLGTDPFCLIPPDDVARVRRFYADVAQQRDSQASVELRLRHQDGAWIDFEGISNNLLGDDNIKGVIITFRNITERKQWEAAQRAKEVAEQASQAKSEFLSRVSHELRTPLNAILGFAQLMARSPRDANDRESLDQILRGGKHLLHLINEVLDIGRIEAGHFALSVEPVLLGNVVNECLQLIMPLAAEQNVDVVVDHLPADAVSVWANAQNLKQILLNLLSNAIKYNRQGGTVHVAFHDLSVETVRLEVADTGIGIAPDKLHCLFEPFNRLGAEHGSTGGTGLGLALSKRLSDAMGLPLQLIESTPRGSIFALDLPRVGSSARGRVPEPEMYSELPVC